jgi:hypothetical protein
MQKESANGRANRRLPDDEWAAVIGRGERERGSGRVPQVSDVRRRRVGISDKWHALESLARGG